MDQAFRLSFDGTTTEFAYEISGKRQTRFSLADSTLVPVTDEVSLGLSSPRTDSPNFVVAEWAHSKKPNLNGLPLRLRNYETSRSLALTPDGKEFLLGTDWNLRYFSSDGTQIWATITPAVAWGVNIAGNGKVAIAALGDGTIRWYRLTDGKELLAFFPHADRKRWVVWTPSGYYNASPGGEDLIGWHVNNGKDKAADFYPASRFRDRFNRDDIVQLVLKTLDEDAAIKQANDENNRKRIATGLKEQLPPVVSIVSPQEGASVSTPTVTVRYSVRTPSRDAVTTVRALVDGRPTSAITRDLQLVSVDGEERSIVVPVPPQNSEVSLIAENKNGASVAARVRIVWKGSPEAFIVKPKLYVLAIGVSAYQDTSLNLNFAAKDARDFAAASAVLKGGLYSEVTTKVLTDASATRREIMKGLVWIQRETTSKDVAMVLLSGHGTNDELTRYYFLPSDFDREELRGAAIPFSEIQNTVQAIAGKALFFIDSCHSGNVMGTGKTRTLFSIDAVINELASADNGVVVFSASTGRQVSWEDPQWSNGAFTKAVVEGFSGKADYNKNGRITVNMLDTYISERVKELTGGRQTPTTQKPTVPDFPIAAR